MTPRRPLTQRDRVLAALRRAGRGGLTQIDFHGPHVVDGGAPITRLAPRIQELRERGHWIDARRDRGLARYVLRRDAERSAAHDDLRLATIEEEELVERARRLLEEPAVGA